MNLMTKRGNLDNVVLYEHYCDEKSDLDNIPLDQINLGSIALVLKDENDSIGFIFRSTEGEDPYRMELYRLNGKKRSETTLNAQYTTARLQNDQILLFDDRNMTVYTSSGHMRFQADYEKTIVDMFYLKEYRKYLVITPDSFDRIRIGT